MASVDPQLDAILQRYPEYSYAPGPWESAGQTGQDWILAQLQALQDTPAQSSYGVGENAWNVDNTDQITGINQDLIHQIVYGPLNPGVYNYTNPDASAYANRAVHNATLTDKMSFLGDNLLPVLALLGGGLGATAAAYPAAFGLGGAAAGAGAGGALGAETIASPLPLAGLEGYTGAAVGAGELGAAGTAAGVAPAAGLATAESAAGTGGLTLAQALKIASLGSSAAGLGQRLAGGSSTGGSAGGGTGVADSTSGQDIGNILTALLGLSGAGLSLADQARLRGQQSNIFGQSQDQLTLLNQLAQLYQQQQQDQYGRSNAAYDERTAQQAADRAKNDVLFNEQQGTYATNLANTAQDRANAQQVFQQSQDAYKTRVGETAQDRANAQQVFGQSQAAYGQQVDQAAQDRATRARILGERTGIGNTLTDPAALSRGAQNLFNPYAQGVQDETVRAINRSQALAGTGDGGVANLAAARALVPVNAQLYQQAMQNFLTSQTSGLGAYDYPPIGPYTPNPQQAPAGPYTAPPQSAPVGPNAPYPQGAPGGPYTDSPPAAPVPPQLQNPGRYLEPPGALNLGAGSSPGDIIGNLTKLLGLGNSPGVIAAVSKLLGLGGNTGNAGVGSNATSYLDALGGGGNGTQTLDNFGGGNITQTDLLNNPYWSDANTYNADAATAGFDLPF